jgi:Tfp pilus assembly protein PilO
MSTKTKIIIAVVAVLIIAGLAYWYYRSTKKPSTTTAGKMAELQSTPVAVANVEAAKKGVVVASVPQVIVK